MLKRVPKYKVGQIVVFTNTRKNIPFIILDARWDDGWYYQFNRNNYVAESMIRKLTPEEIG